MAITLFDISSPWTSILIMRHFSLIRMVHVQKYFENCNNVRCEIIRGFGKDVDPITCVEDTESSCCMRCTSYLKYVI